MAQERKKRRIVLASILKPVDDTRMLEKMGKTLAANGYEVVILGYPSVAVSQPKGIQLILLPASGRLTFQRLFARLRVATKALALKPDIFIFHTHELLVAAMIIKILTNARIVYDVRENYYRNILYGGSFPNLLRWPLATAVRFKEKILAPVVDHFFLAEKSYESEFKFHRGGWTVLENKAPDVPLTRSKSTNMIRLLFTGTLAESTGVLTAIDIASRMHALDSSVTLTIIGYAASPILRQQLHEASQRFSFMRLVGIDHLVPHWDILEAIRHADLGMLTYPNSPHTDGSRPTKLFEYLHAQLPILVDGRWSWISEYQSYHPFIVSNLDKPDAPEILHALKTDQFYTAEIPGVTWSTEEPKLLSALASL